LGLDTIAPDERLEAAIFGVQDPADWSRRARNGKRLDRAFAAIKPEYLARESVRRQRVIAKIHGGATGSAILAELR
jgi:hypothetical protein